MQYEIEDDRFDDNQRDECGKKGKAPGSASIPKNEEQAKIL